MSELLLAIRPCTQCLTSPERIVSGQRAAQIIRDCRRTRRHFRCHKGDQAGLNVHCRGVHDLCGSLAHDVAVAAKIPVREIDTDRLLETPHAAS